MEADPGLLPAGTMLGHYRLDALLGQGAFGAVYRAISSSDGARVAVKVLGRRGSDADATIARFHREAELASRLRHPNSVHVLDRGEAHGWHFIAFELLEGESLETHVERTGRVAPERAMEIAIQILDGLEEAHAIGLVHRDIKPANVFLVRHGDAGAPRVKIVDFGLAKSTNPGTLAGLTRAGTTVGTPLYMSPEQILGNEVRPESDLFSLGVVLAELIHGGSLYPDDAQVMSMLTERIAGKPVPIPPELAASPLRTVVERATRPDPRERFPTAASMRAALVGLRGAIRESSRVAAGPTQAVPIAGAQRVDVSDLIANRTVDLAPLGMNRAITAAPEPVANLTAVASPASPSAPRAGRSLALPLGIVAALVVAGAAVTSAIVLASGSPASSSAKPSALPPPPRTSAEAAAPPSSASKTDWLSDPTPLVALLKSRFGSERVHAIMINAASAYVTVEATPGATVLYVVTAKETKKHQEANGPAQQQPIDLGVLDRLPSMLADALQLASAHKGMTLQWIDVTCRSCRNSGGGFSFGFNDRASGHFGVDYDLKGNFVSAR